MKSAPGIEVPPNNPLCFTACMNRLVGVLTINCLTVFLLVGRGY